MNGSPTCPRSRAMGTVHAGDRNRRSRRSVTSTCDLAHWAHGHDLALLRNPIESIQAACSTSYGRVARARAVARSSLWELKGARKNPSHHSAILPSSTESSRICGCACVGHALRLCSLTAIVEAAWLSSGAVIVRLFSGARDFGSARKRDGTVRMRTGRVRPQRRQRGRPPE
jgi:hypothetical protein